MPSQIVRHRIFSNGLTLIVEPMADVQSAAFAIMVPAGGIYERRGCCGTAAALSDLLTRGAGKRDSRQLSDALDVLGLQRGESAGWNFLTLSGAALGKNIPAALELYGDILLRPALPGDQMEAVLAGVEQNLLSIEDEPQRKVLVELRKQCYDDPWGRSADGELSDLEKIDIDLVREHFASHVRPNGTIIGVAGQVDVDEIEATVERNFGAWEPGPDPVLERRPHATGYCHLTHESAQTHLSLAYPAVPFGHEDYYAAWGAVSILSGGSSSRLFTEIREKRGLCYSVYATHHSLLHEARILAYAGTTPERAQATWDVMLEEFERLAAGIEPAELERCQARAKSSLIMQQESTGSRASSLARDWFHLQRIKPLQEVREQIDALTVERVVDYVRRNPLREMNVLTVGPEPLEMPAGIQQLAAVE